MSLISECSLIDIWLKMFLRINLIIMPFNVMPTWVGSWCLFIKNVPRSINVSADLSAFRIKELELAIDYMEINIKGKS